LFQEDAFNSGIAVRIITDGRTYRDKGSDIAQLSRSGIPVHIHTTEGHMHTKFVIVDRLVTMSGSMNWTLSANHSNFEHVVISSSKQLVVGFQSFFDTMWADSNHFVDFPK
jgi:phosphatidylserine/phosphatidylglycerophosphate/cardiolipin synthase-like enzyme